MRSLLLLFALLCTAASAQEPGVFEIVEVQPELIGGLEGLQRRVEYPEMARRAGIEGMVYLQFVVDEQGGVSETSCPRMPNQMLCDAATKALRDSRFHPGLQDGVPVKVRYTLPVRFALRDADERLSPFVFYYALMGEQWDEVLAQRRVGPPRTGIVKDGSGTIVYHESDPGATPIVVTITGGRIARLDATFETDDGRQFVADWQRALTEEHGEPADNGAYSPEQLGRPVRVHLDTEAGRLTVEYRAPASPGITPDTVSLPRQK